MMTRSTLLSIGVLTAIALPIARAADLRPAVVTNLTGTLRIQQPIPCNGSIDETTALTAGRLELTPAEGFDVAGGAKSFTLTRVALFFAGFTASGSCFGFDHTQTYGPIGVNLARTVAFTATPTGTPGVYAATIPNDRLLLSYSTTVNGVRDAALKHPREDATARIDLAAATMSMRVVLGTRAVFKAGCVGDDCVLNETHLGTVTVNLAGTIALPDADGDGVPDRRDNCRFTANPTQSPVPTPAIETRDVTVGSCLTRHFAAVKAADVCDGTRVTVTHNARLPFAPGANTILWRAEDGLHRVATASQIVTVADKTPPTVLCTATHSPGGAFHVSATDDCDGPAVLTLGRYVLGEGEVIKITETGQPGVRLQNVVGADRIRHFHVGRGQAGITATDGAGNVSSVACAVPR